MQVQQKNLNEQIQNELRHMTDFSAPYHYGEDRQTFATPRIFGTIGRKLKRKVRSKKAVSLVMVILAATIMSILMIPITRWWVNLNSNLNQSEQRVAMQGAAQNVLADLSQESYDELIDYFVDDSDFHPGTASSKDDVLKNKTEPGYYKGTDPDTGDIAIWKLSIDENGVRTVTQYIYGHANEMIQDGIYNGSGVGYFMDNGECKRFSPASSSGYDPVTNMPEPCMKVGITVSDGTGRDYSTNTYKRSSLLRSIIPIGSIIAWPTNSIPTYGRGVWLECNGQSFSSTQFPQLYETLGKTTVPDYRGRFLVGAGSGYSVGGTGGSDTVTLTEGQMPRHTHSVSASSEFMWGGPFLYPDAPNWSGLNLHGFTATDSGDWEMPGTYGLDPNLDGSSDFEFYLATFEGRVNVSIGTAGGSQSHENRPPFIGVKWMIKAK